MPVRIAPTALVPPSPPCEPRRRLPVADHLLEISDQQLSRSLEIVAAPVAMAAGAARLGVIGIGPIAGAGPGAVQVLAPQHEFDGVIAGGDVGLDTTGLLQRVLQKVRRDPRDVQFFAADGDRVWRRRWPYTAILVALIAVALVDIVDQPFVERPGIDPALPLVDDRIAETECLGLLIGWRRPRPGVPPSASRRIGDQRVDRFVQRLGRGERSR